MSVSESFTGETPQFFQPRPSPNISPDIVDKLSEALNTLMTIQSAGRAEVPASNFLGRSRPTDSAPIIFRGKLNGDAEALYPVIEERFKQLGYTPTLQREGDMDVVVAIDGIISARKISSPGWVHGLLLIITLITTMLSGAAFQGIDPGRLFNEITRVHNYALLWIALKAGAPFALPLLLILGIHEMGHYIAARRHKIDVTLPYFIPMPPMLSILGTLGAVIFIKGVLTNRKSLFDVGISGPLAGFVVAFFAFIIGIKLPAATRSNPVFTLAFMDFKGVGMPLLLQGLGQVFRPDIKNLGLFVSNQPVALAAWFGMLLTVLNLMPIGQLDGGHVMYTLFGRFAWTIAYATFAALIILGIVTDFYTLIFYALLAMLTGLRHPPPVNDITPLDWKRKALGYATIVLFFLIATPTPILGQMR